jgi:hypothetical protein
MLTTLRRIDEMDISDFSVSQQDYDEMLEVQRSGTKVEVDEIETAAYGYYDVILPSGRIVYALSWYHITGFQSPFAK